MTLPVDFGIAKFHRTRQREFGSFPKERSRIYPAKPEILIRARVIAAVSAQDS